MQHFVDRKGTRKLLNFSQFVDDMDLKVHVDGDENSVSTDSKHGSEDSEIYRALPEMDPDSDDEGTGKRVRSKVPNTTIFRVPKKNKNLISSSSLSDASVSSF